MVECDRFRRHGDVAGGARHVVVVDLLRGLGDGGRDDVHGAVDRERAAHRHHDVDVGLVARVGAPLEVHVAPVPGNQTEGGNVGATFF